MRGTPVIVILGVLVTQATALAERISFARDVMPVLSRAGCNTGGCHGHRDGRGELKLSLWGESPADDVKALTTTEDVINRKAPAASRLLKKPTLQMEHEGEKRFGEDSHEYRVLLRWLEEGARDDTVDAPALESLIVTPESQILTEPRRELQLRVEAVFADGEKRDVTYWSVYSLSNLVAEVSGEGLVRFLKPGETTVLVRYLDQRVTARLALVPDRPDFAWESPPVANEIDRQVFAKLRTLRMNPSGPCDDATFVRRAFLDIIGTLPTAEEARRFIESGEPDKRAALVDALLERPEYAQFWALKWSDLLRNEEKVLDRTGVEKFHAWLRTGFAEGKGLRRARPRHDHLARKHLQESARQLLPRPAQSRPTAPRPPPRFSSAPACAARSATTIPSTAGRRTSTTSSRPSSTESTTSIIENKRRDKHDKNQFIGEQEVLLVAKREFVDPRTRKPPTARLLGSRHPAIEGQRLSRLVVRS